MTSSHRTILTIAFTIALICDRSTAQVASDNPTGVAGQFNGNVTTGCSYDPYTGNATRSITDLVVAGTSGTYPLSFTRTMNSRYEALQQTPFGEAGSWNHSYGWTIENAARGSGSNWPSEYWVNYPDGRRVNFMSRGSDLRFRGPSGVRDRFKQLDGTNQTDGYVLLPDGGKVHFTATFDTSIQKFRFTLVGIIDPYLQTTNITYPDNTSILITEPAGRWIKLFYRTITQESEGAIGDFVVDHITASDSRSVQYYYAPQITPKGVVYTSLSSVIYFNDPFWTASYTYQFDNIAANGRPLIATCIDPMFDGALWKISYQFATGTNPDGTSVASGQLYQEKHINGTPVSTLTVIGSGSRKETRGDNPTFTGQPYRTFTYNNYRLVTTTDFKNIGGSQDYDANNHYYLKSITDRKGNITEYECSNLSGNTRHVKYPDTPGDTLPGTPTMALNYTYGDSSNDDPNNDNPNNPYYLFAVKNGRNFVNKYYRDTNKQVKRITYPNHIFETFTFNPYGQKLTHTLRDTSVESWQYNDPAHVGQASAFFDAANTTATPTTRFAYDLFGRLWKATDGRGGSPGDPKYTTTFEYNLRGQMTKLTHPDGTFVENHYNPEGTIQSTTDELQHTTTYVYDEYKRVRTVTTPLRAPNDNTPRTTITYYDDSLACVQSGQCLDNYSRTDAKATRTISPGGKTTITKYDENLRVLSVTAAGDSHVPSGTTIYAYDLNGNKETVQDPNGNVTRTYYDKQNRVSFIDDPMVNDPLVPHRNSDNHTVSYVYDEGGNKIQERRVDSKICKYGYDDMGKLQKKSGYAVESTPDPFPDMAHYEYDDLGNLKKMTDPLTHEYEYTYDGLNRKLTAKYPNDAGGTRRVESWHYNIANQLDTYTNPAGQVQTLQYDSRGRLTNAVWSSNGAATTTAYDAASRPLSIITSNGSVVSYHYDDANNKIWEEQSIGGQPAAQPVQPISAVSRKTHAPNVNYDINLPLTDSPGVECRNGPDHKIVITFPNAVTVSGASVTGGAGSVLNSSGNQTNTITVNLTGVANAQTVTVALWNTSDGLSVGNVYLQMAVLLGDVTGNGIVNSTDVSEVQYNSGSAVSATNFRDDVNANYQINSSDVSTVQFQSGTALPQIAGPVHRVQTDPDADGNRSDLVVTTGGATNYSLTYQYTSRNGIWQISEGAHTFTYQYIDNNANVAQVAQSGQFSYGSTTFAYDPLNRPTLATHTGLNGVTLETMNYEYTNRGGLRDSYRSGGSIGDFYTYGNNRDQLVNAKYSATGVSGPNPNPVNPARTVDYDCDAVNRNGMTIADGNGTTNVVYAKDNLNQYTDVVVNGTHQSPQYDNNFNLTGYEDWIYDYDAQNRLSSASGHGHTASFMYDGTGRCVRRVIDSVPTVFT